MVDSTNIPDWIERAKQDYEHLTVILAALAVVIYIEAMMGFNIKKFIRVLASIRTGVISVNGVSLPIKPQIPNDVTVLLKHLKI